MPLPKDDIPTNTLTRLCATRLDDAIHVTLPSGKADGVAVRELYELSAQLLDRHHTHIVVDFTNVNFVPSGMMGMLITVRKKLMGTGGQLHVVINDELVLNAFHLMKLDRILSLCNSLDEAITRLNPPEK